MFVSSVNSSEISSLLISTFKFCPFMYIEPIYHKFIAVVGELDKFHVFDGNSSSDGLHVGAKGYNIYIYISWLNT
jgi:hypothetical protein